MATYNVRADGSATNKEAATDITGASTSMSWATFLTEFSGMSSGDIVVVSSRGGEITSSVNFANNSVSGLIVQGETEYTPTIDLQTTGRFQVAALNGCKFTDLIINNPNVSGIEFITSGTGHEVRRVLVDGSSNQAFQNSGSCGVDYYDVTGRNCTDDGFSLHDTAKVNIYGGRFYGNADGIAIVGAATLVAHDVKCFSNSEYDFGAGNTAVGITATFYDSEFGGAVVAGTTDDTNGTVNFHRSIFHCNAVSSIASVSDAAVNVGSGVASRVFSSDFNSCLFLQPPAGKAQLLLRSGAGGIGAVTNCTFAQKTEVYRALWLLSTDPVTIKNSLFYNASAGIRGGNTVAHIIDSCNFTACTADTENLGAAVITNTVSGTAAFNALEAGDWSLASGNTLEQGGFATTVKFDASNKLFPTVPDVGCYSSATGRRFTPGIRPTR